MKDLIKSLCEAFGPPGREAQVVELIEKNIKTSCQHNKDDFGNVIVFKKGRSRAKQKVLLIAQMDEPAFFVKNITKEGCLKLEQTGEVDPNVLVGKAVLVFDKGKVLPGVVGVQPVHLQGKEERTMGAELKDLAVDIGCASKEQAQKLVCPGAEVGFWPECEEFGDDLLKTKAAARLGCAVLMKLLCEFDEFDFYVAFCSAGQTSEAGALAAARSVGPEIAIVVGCTEAEDTPAAGRGKEGCCLKKGPTVNLVGKEMIYNQELTNIAIRVAEEKGLLTQNKKVARSGSKLAQVYSYGTGIKTLEVVFPARYLRAAECVVSMLDLEQTGKLLKVILNKIAGGE